MKKIFLGINFKQILLLVAIIYATDTYAQEEKKNYIGMNYSFGWSNYNKNGITSDALRSLNTNERDNFKSMSIEYAYQTAPYVEFCTGLTATTVCLAAAFTYVPDVGGNGGSYTSVYSDEIFIFFLPLHVKSHFLKYLFVEGGIDLNYSSGKDYRYGAGLIAGIGVKYEFHSGITFSASPFRQWSLLMGNAEDSITESDDLSQWGIKLGIGCRF
jgi:hypothetical protein